MTDKQKLNKFLKLQDKGVSIDEIAIQLNSEIKPLRRFLNKNGYKSVKGKYVKKDNNSEQCSKSSAKPQKTKVYKDKPKKVNVSAEDLDKLCEVYDWYLSVKDIKSLKPKIQKSKKDILIEECDFSNLKNTRVQIEKSTWEEFERLCSNSKYSKQQIITQAIKEFLKQYKHLI